MATYKEIQTYVKSNYGYTLKSCWIAHCKEVFGLSPKVSKNRINIEVRKHPCPEGKLDDIRNTFIHFGMI